MKAAILDGSQANDTIGQRVFAALAAQFQAQGWQVEHFILREKKIGACAGDFFCWVRTPGVCNVKDDNLAIAEALATSDVMVYLSPITFGGYSSTLKRMVDHQIQNVSPFFTKVNDETHHMKRYQKNPDFLAVGWMEQADDQIETIFRHLVQRNAVNWHAERYACGVVVAGQTDEELQVAARGWLAALSADQGPAPITLPAENGTGGEDVAVRRALLLVGSPKTRKSTSNSLGGYLFEHLAQGGIQTETVYLHTVLRSSAKWQALLEAMEAADLVTLAFPLYVDTLPAPVTEAMERIAAHRQVTETRPQLFSAVVNCGFPEAYQTATALAICRTFAQQAGFAWAGSLALGGGEAINGASLVEAGGKAIRIRHALEMAAAALAQGQAIPQKAVDMMAKPVIPHWLYRLTGKLRWNSWAKQHNAKKLLKRQPYLAHAR